MKTAFLFLLLSASFAALFVTLGSAWDGRVLLSAVVSAGLFLSFASHYRRRPRRSLRSFPDRS